MLLLALLQATAIRPHVAVSLVPEHAVVVPGAPTRVALRFRVEPGWHIYWRNPGESGVATTAAWAVPAGFSVDSLEYPTPKRRDVAGVVTHILEGDVVLRATIRVPAKATSRDSRLATRVSYGVCKDVCYPGEASVQVEPGLGAAPRPNPDWPAADSIFAATRPRTGGLGVSVDPARGRLVLTLPRGCRADTVTFFPWDREVMAAAVTAPVPPGCGPVTLAIPLADRPTGMLRGVVVLGNERRGHEIGRSW